MYMHAQYLSNNIELIYVIVNGFDKNWFPHAHYSKTNFHYHMHNIASYTSTNNSGS